MNSANYPWTPKALTIYICPKLEQAFKKQGEDKTRQAIDQLFEVACKITSLTPDDLLIRLGFDPNNKDDDNIQSLFGVMRTITTLHNCDFTEITPLSPSNSYKEADLVATRNSQRYAVEVFRANERTWRYPGYKCESHIATRYEKEKKAQLDSTMVRHNCTKAIVAVVFDSDSKALLDDSDILGIVETVHHRTGAPDNTHFLLFTGMQTPDHGDDVVVWPPFT